MKFFLIVLVVAVCSVVNAQANVRDKLDHVIDAAQRAGVVVYTIHAAGLVNDTFLDPGNKRPMDANGRVDIASIGELEANIVR